MAAADLFLPTRGGESYCVKIVCALPLQAGRGNGVQFLTSFIWGWGAVGGKADQMKFSEITKFWFRCRDGGPG